MAVKPEITAKQVQEAVNGLFSEFRAKDPYMEFHPDNAKIQAQVIQRLDTKAQESKQAGNTVIKSIKSAIILAMDLITKEKLHPSLVKFALGIFLTHSKDAQSIRVGPPSIKYHSDFSSARKPPLSNPVTGDNMKGNELLSYFREDLDLNDHHFHWHMVYPYAGVIKVGKHGTRTFHRAIERQGELFLYMHSQMIARHNAESVSWGLPMTSAWEYDDIFTFGYTPVPGIRDLYGSRPPDKGWFDTHNPDISDKDAKSGFPSKAEMKLWRDNIFAAIRAKRFKTRGGGQTPVVLDGDEMINLVGVVVEAEDHGLQYFKPGMFMDWEVYGNVHNLGHDKFAAIGYKTDKNPYDVMISSIGSIRDPCFWRWHGHIDNFRQEVVESYTQDITAHQPENLTITDLKIVPRSTPDTKPVDQFDRVINTFLGPPQVDNNEVNARMDHEPYNWNVTVSSITRGKETATSFTVRIFITQANLIDDQRSWIEMDKFTAKFTAPTVSIVRKDKESTVARKEGEDLSPRCRCGWPQNMMLPIGTTGGADYVAFAMLTAEPLGGGGTQSSSFCGAIDDKYPDPLGMGYPFQLTWDLRKANPDKSMQEIIAHMPNIKLYDFKIQRHTKLYQGDLTDLPPSTITWENTIKGYFSPMDVDCMNNVQHNPIDLTNYSQVVSNANDIFFEVYVKDMPYDEKEKKTWAVEGRVAKFKEWIDHGFE